MIYDDSMTLQRNHAILHGAVLNIAAKAHILAVQNQADCTVLLNPMGS